MTFTLKAAALIMYHLNQWFSTRVVTLGWVTRLKKWVARMIYGEHKYECNVK